MGDVPLDAPYFQAMKEFSTPNQKASNHRSDWANALPSPLSELCDSTPTRPDQRRGRRRGFARVSTSVSRNRG